MLTEICAKIKNYFCLEGDKIFGDFAIENGAVTPSFSIANGQYYRIIGSVFNDGVHKYGDTNDVLKDEGTFHGAIWLMRVPQDIIDLEADIASWKAQYGTMTSPNMSPFSSESFGGYSYSKASASSSNAGGANAVVTWEDVFADRLSPYRRIRVI